MRERRLGARKAVRIPAKIIDAHGYALDVNTSDVSRSGARVEIKSGDPLPKNFWLYIEHLRQRKPAELIWRRNENAGVRFVDAGEEAGVRVPLRNITETKRLSLDELRRIAQLRSK
jgi:hypothetical protein